MSNKQLAHPKSTNELPADIERIGLRKHLRPINTAKKKRLKKVKKATVFRKLISKEGHILETNPLKKLVTKDALIFLELLLFNLTILKRKKV